MQKKLLPTCSKCYARPIASKRSVQCKQCRDANRRGNKRAQGVKNNKGNTRTGSVKKKAGKRGGQSKNIGNSRLLLVGQPYCKELAAGSKTIELRGSSLGLVVGGVVSFVESSAGGAAGAKSLCYGHAILKRVTTPTKDKLPLDKIGITTLSGTPAEKYTEFWCYEFEKSVLYTEPLGVVFAQGSVRTAMKIAGRLSTVAKQESKRRAAIAKKASKSKATERCIKLRRRVEPHQASGRHF